MSESLQANGTAMSVSFRGRLSAADVARLGSSSILVAGLGNIGSHAALLFARMNVGVLRVVDRGLIEPKNFKNQAYLGADQAGRPKAEVIAEQVRRIDPRVVVEPIVADVEDVPLAKFADVNLCLGGLDSLQARQVAGNERAYRMGVAYVDGGVDADGEWVGKVQVLLPEKACLECSWGDEHYRQIGRETPCDPDGEVTGSPTLAPALMGNSVASLMVAEGVKLLLGVTPSESFEIAFDLSARRWLSSTLRRAPRCRFDHQVIREMLPLKVPFPAATVGDLLAVLRTRFGDESVQLEFRRHVFDNKLYRAGRSIPVSHLEQLASRRLTELHLTPDDCIRVEHRGASLAIALRQPK